MVYVVGVLYAAFLVSAAVTDVAAYRISNWIVVALCLIFPIGALAASFEPVTWGFHGLGLLTAFAVGVLAWHVRLVGGGDVKLIAALGLWTGLHRLPDLLLVIALVGGGVTVVLLVVRACAQRCLARSDRLPAVVQKGEPVPYGVAIALGGLLIMPDVPILAPIFVGL